MFQRKTEKQSVGSTGRSNTHLPPNNVWYLDKGRRHSGQALILKERHHGHHFSAFFFKIGKTTILLVAHGYHLYTKVPTYIRSLKKYPD